MTPSVKSLKIIAILTALLLVSGCGINNIPTFDEDVDSKWSEVQNQYKRRADLVPNLIETVKGFAAQEKDVFIEVTEARAKVGQMNVSPETLIGPGCFRAVSAEPSWAWWRSEQSCYWSLSVTRILNQTRIFTSYNLSLKELKTA